MNGREKRFKVVGWIILACWLGLLGRVFYLQFCQGAEYAEKAWDNTFRTKTILPARGSIYDCRGRVLARNVVSFYVAIDPTEVGQAMRTLDKANKILKLPAKKYKELRQRVEANQAEPIVLKENLDNVTVARLAEAISDIPGLRLDVKYQRDYPYKSVGGHLLGYVSEIDEQGLKEMADSSYQTGELVGYDGLEYVYERKLHGMHGYTRYNVDISGKPVGNASLTPACPGDDLYLSIDIVLQAYAEDCLADTLACISRKNGERSGGAVVAVETKTGFVRAMASLPGYDPNWFASGISSKRYSRLINDKCYPLLNRAVSSAHPPGSTFKLVTTAAALQEGIISPGSYFYCPGVYYVAGLPFNCFVRTGHGGLNLIECIAHSCDVSYYQMGVKLKLERLHRYASLFGLGEKTGIDLPGETPGLFPYPGWKEKVYKEKWFPGDDANASIGQGFVLATPLQMAMMTSAVANGGDLFRPQMLESESVNPTDGRGEPVVKRRSPVLVRHIPVEKSYLSAVRQGMRGTVAYGTAAKYSRGIYMAGKTGTAENSPTEDNPYGRNHAWFTGFYPYDDPELTVTVILEKSGGYGGELAAPVAFDVVRKWRKLQKEL